MEPTGSQLYTQGRLQEAVKVMGEEVKRHPMDGARRGFLAELLCIAGELERADKQLDVLSTQDPSAAVGVALLRQLVRAELARQEFYKLGHVPEFLADPTPQLRAHLQAAVLLRAGDSEQAAALLSDAERDRVPVAGTCNGQRFEDFRDIDDVTASFFEVLTSTGKYYWIGFDAVESVEFHAPEHPHDLLWRRARMCVRGGPDGEVFLPAIYADPEGEGDEQMRLGRATDWRGGDGSPVRGLGQRSFLVEDGGCPIMELETLSFESS